MAEKNQHVLSNGDGANKIYLHRGTVSIRESVYVSLHLLVLSHTRTHSLSLIFIYLRKITCKIQVVWTGDRNGGDRRIAIKQHCTNNSSRLVASYCRRSWLSCCHSYGHRSSAAPATKFQPLHPPPVSDTSSVLLVRHPVICTHPDRLLLLFFFVCFVSLWRTLPQLWQEQYYHIYSIYSICIADYIIVSFENIPGCITNYYLSFVYNRSAKFLFVRLSVEKL